MWLFGRRRKQKSQDRTEEILYNMQLLARVEEDIAGFYELCSATYPDDRDFWEQMAADERQHAAHLDKMQELVRKSPEDFRPGSRFSTASIRLFEMTIRDLPPRRRLEEMNRSRVLSLAQEIENSAIETAYADIVETENQQFKDLGRQIDRDSAKHYKQVAEMIVAEETEGEEELESPKNVRSA